jgi:hypothetical protein
MIATTGATSSFSSSAVRKSDAHAEESFEEFSARYVESQWLVSRESIGIAEIGGKEQIRRWASKRMEADLSR